MKNSDELKNLSKIMFLLLVVVFLIIRLHMHGYVNDWVDYDGACYYLDAKHLLDGYTPYKDFILVHPLSFILFLAFFIKFFNMDFISMFYLIYGLNLIGLIYMYKIGKQLKDEYFGIFLSLIYVLDPILMTYGKVPMIESLLIPLFTAAIYYLLKYSFEKKNAYAYLSFFICGIALSLKMTMMPMFLASLVFLYVLSQKHLLTEIYNAYVKKLPNIFLKSLIIYLIIVFFFELNGLISAKEVFIPILSNMHKDFSNFLWIMVFVYIFMIISICSLLNKFKLTVVNMRLILTCFLIGMFSKVVEFLMGFWIGGFDYINQCYVVNSGRFGLVPFTLFSIIPQLVGGIYCADWAIVHGFGFIILIILYVSLIKIFKNNINSDDDIQYSYKLLFTYFLLVLITYNIIPTLLFNVRYVFPTYILFIVSLTYWMWNNILKIKYKQIILSSFCILLVLNSFICISEGERTGFYFDVGNSVTEDNAIMFKKLHDYLIHNDILDKKIFSTSPVPMAYLDLNSSVKYTDTFAPFFMEKISSDELLSNLRDENVEYIMITPWAWSFNIQNTDIGKTILLNYSLKYEVGDNITQILLYDLEGNKNDYSLFISKGNLTITDFNNTNILINLNAINYELISQSNSTYLLKYDTPYESNLTANMVVDKNSLLFESHSPIKMYLKNDIVIIDGNITYVHKKEISLNNVSSIVVFSHDKLNITGKNICGVINNSELIIDNPNIRLWWGN